MTSRHPDALVFALCHEIGNLLTAMRLRADALRAGAATGAAGAGDVLSSLALRSGALLTWIRPLLVGPASSHPVSAGEALARLSPDLREAGGGRARVEPPEAGAPAADCDPELLHQLLLGACLTALDEAGTDGTLRVGAVLRRERVVFALEHDGLWRTAPGSSRPASSRPTGLALVRAVADEILGRLGGRATLEPGRFELELPAAPPPCD